MLKKLLLQRAARLDVEAAVYRLVRHVIPLRTWEHVLEPSGNLLGRPLELELAGDQLGQFLTLGQLTTFGATRLIPSMLIRLDRALCRAATVAIDFSADG